MPPQTAPAAATDETTETPEKAEKPAPPEQTDAQSAIADWIDDRFTVLARGRWAEEREWFQEQRDLLGKRGTRRGWLEG